MLRLDAIPVFLQTIGNCGRVASPRAHDNTLCRSVTGIGRFPQHLIELGRLLFWRAAACIIHCRVQEDGGEQRHSESSHA
jgi:hypothetical protein